MDKRCSINYPTPKRFQNFYIYVLHIHCTIPVYDFEKKGFPFKIIDHQRPDTWTCYLFLLLLYLYTLLTYVTTI